MIDSYLNQTATIKKKTGVNDYNEPVFAAEVEIKCLITPKMKMVRDKEKQTIISETAIFTKSPLAAGDVIAFGGIEMVVISVASQYGLDGNIEFYEGSL